MFNDKGIAMIQVARLFVARACGVAALLALGACGGGAEPEAGAVPQSITFTLPGELTFGAVPAPLAATSSAGLAVFFTSATPATCTVSGLTVKLLAAGQCTIEAAQTGDKVYAAATPVSTSFAVRAAAQTISFISPGNQTLGSAPAALVASATSGLPVALLSSTPAVCTVAGSTLSLLGLGTCTVAASQPGNANYQPAPAVSHGFTVGSGLAAQAINFASPGNQTLGTAPAALAATATSGLPVFFASITPAVCSVSGSTLTLVSAGACTVGASQPGSSAFAAAAVVLNTVNVALRAQTIRFIAPGTQALGGAAPVLAATSSAGLTVAFASATPSVCAVGGSTVTLLAVGTCTIDASQAGNLSTAPAAGVSASFTVTVAAQSISFASPGSQTLGSAPAPLLATASSGLPVLLASTTPSVCSVSGTALTLLAAGTCTVSASQAGNATYGAAPAVSHSFTVTAAALLAQSISFTAPGGQTLGTAPAPLLATASSGLPVLLASTTASVCSVSGTALTLLAAGTCTVSASQAGNAVFAPAVPAANSFTVAAAAQSISFAGPGGQTLGTAPAPLLATSTSGLLVSFASLTPATCGVSGSTLGLIAAGTCTLVASQAGNASFAAASPVSQSFTIAAAPAERFANGGFETPGLTTPALGWLGANLGYTVTTDAHSGLRAALLSANVTSTAAVLLQNSKDQGGLPDLVVGESLVLSFWAKGTPGTTGDLIYALRFLNSNGNILAPTVGNSNVNFGALINPNSWTKITRAALLVPTGATAAFLEISSGIGPVDPANGFFAGSVKIDDISLQRAP